MQLTIPQITIGILRVTPTKRLYLEAWSDGSLMIGLWRAIIFLTVWPKSLNDPGDDHV
jgi:hypothetical protein